MRPEFLQPNNKVAIVAPSGRVFQEELLDNLALLDTWKLVPVFGDNLYADFYNGYHYAGTVQQRLHDFQFALDHDEIKAIWCARGGYGAVQLLDQLNWDKFLREPKWLIGYSDITAFHNHLNNWDIPTIHAITVKKLNSNYSESTFKTLQKALFGEGLKYEISSHPLNKTGNARGKLVGGNLSIIYSLSGSWSALQGDNLVLFIEDWNENWYHLDRMLMNLKRSGLLGRIKGLIVGSFTRMDLEEENPDFLAEYDKTSYEIIYQFIENYNIPVCFEFPAGHIGDNRALVMGSEVTLDVKENIVLLNFEKQS